MRLSGMQNKQKYMRLLVESTVYDMISNVWSEYEGLMYEEIPKTE